MLLKRLKRNKLNFKKIKTKISILDNCDCLRGKKLLIPVFSVWIAIKFDLQSRWQSRGISADTALHYYPRDSRDVTVVCWWSMRSRRRWNFGVSRFLCGCWSSIQYCALGTNGISCHYIQLPQCQFASKLDNVQVFFHIDKKYQIFTFDFCLQDLQTPLGVNSVCLAYWYSLYF